MYILDNRMISVSPELPPGCNILGHQERASCTWAITAEVSFDSGNTTAVQTRDPKPCGNYSASLLTHGYLRFILCVLKPERGGRNITGDIQKWKLIIRKSSPYFYIGIRQVVDGFDLIKTLKKLLTMVFIKKKHTRAREIV